MEVLIRMTAAPNWVTEVDAGAAAGNSPGWASQQVWENIRGGRPIHAVIKQQGGGRGDERWLVINPDHVLFVADES